MPPDPEPQYEPAAPANRARSRRSCDSALLTDLYQLNMLQAYRAYDMRAVAVFDFFVRRLPANRNFLLFAGLEELLDFLETLRFDDEELTYLRRSGRFRPDFVDSLTSFSFTGDVDAMPEGTPFFGNEPVVRVVAPLLEAQLIETRLINLLHFETLVASKAARIVFAAGGKQLVDFGLRRAHGAEAGLLAARASYLAGFAGTATVLAENRFGIPIFGTMAHSFIQAHDDEAVAFEHFARVHPERLTLLIDTYDTERAAEQVVELAARLARDGISVSAVRIDSGDLVDHARKVRRILDRGGQEKIAIFASGGLDEYELSRFAALGAPIDGYGIGTNLTTSSDTPAIDCVYKLAEYDGQPRLKLSEGKVSWPGRKQVFRKYDQSGTMVGDIVALDGTDVQGDPLLKPVMRGGHRLAGLPSLDEARVHAAHSLARLPEELGRLEPAHYPVEIDAGLRTLAASIHAAD